MSLFSKDFSRKLRQIVQSLPIPGIGISISDGKTLFQGAEQNPGGTLVYEPPAPATVTAGDYIAAGVPAAIINEAPPGADLTAWLQEKGIIGENKIDPFSGVEVRSASKSSPLAFYLLILIIAYMILKK